MLDDQSVREGANGSTLGWGCFLMAIGFLVVALLPFLAAMFGFPNQPLKPTGEA